MHCVLLLKHVSARFMLDYHFLLSNKKLGRRTSKKIPGYSFFTVSRLKRLVGQTISISFACRTFFELVRFDFILDADMKVWLMEV